MFTSFKVGSKFYIAFLYFISLLIGFLASLLSTIPVVQCHRSGLVGAPFEVTPTASRLKDAFLAVTSNKSGTDAAGTGSSAGGRWGWEGLK